jgi:DNA-binding transcriptional MerR regulator
VKSDEMQPLLLTGEIAKTCGVSVDTVRHYEKLALIPPATRTQNGYRHYPAEAIDRVRMVRRAVALGFTLDELSRILRQRDSGRAPCREVRALAERKLAEIDRRLAEMHALRETLSATVASWDVRLAATPAGQRACLLESLIERRIDE